MTKGFWLRASVTLWAASNVSFCLAEAEHGPAAGGAAPRAMLALADQDLKDIHGAGLDEVTLRQIGQAQRQAAGHASRESEEARKRAADTANNAALMAALDLQTAQGTRLAATAVQTVTAAAQIGGTLIALTPVTALVPIGLPLFGLPSLPPHGSSSH